MYKLLYLILGIVIINIIINTTFVYPKDVPEINTILMRSTFKISASGVTGTAFILARPSKITKECYYFVLVTAAHVLQKMSGDSATLFLRKSSGDSFVKVPYSIQIRKGQNPLWIKHPLVDVAAMYVSLPKDIDLQLLPVKLLVTDQLFEEFEVHPGDRLSCLGFPLTAESNDAGFPILRSGQIASYPLVPIKSTKTFLFDFNVFEGNSGGPVYFVDSNRNYAGEIHFSRIQFLMGLVSEQKFAEENVETLRESSAPSSFNLWVKTF